jgi:hypothetical protein
MAVLACGFVVGLSSLYLLGSEASFRTHGLLGYKLLATSMITLLFSVGMIVGSIVWLSGI